MFRAVCIALVVFLAFQVPVMAQTAKEPPMPKPLQEQRDRGAQVFYLGQFESLDGWVMIRASQPEFYYVTADGKAMIMGFLFNAEGKLLTGEQLSKLGQADKQGLVKMVAPKLGLPETQAPDVMPPPQNQSQENLSASEKLLADMQAAPSVVFGDVSKPMFYAFIDPNCAHCNHFLKSVEANVVAGQFSVRIIPVGFDAQSQKQGAFALAVGDGAKRFVDHAKGIEAALNTPDTIDTNAVNANVQLMNDWGLSGTPIILYKAAGSGQIKIIRGRPLDLPATIKDLTGG
jgi:thiol:disulfide interchange protein DsbG